jgi:1-aminocyclopropane-1-carboxylate deaminase
LYRDKHTEEFKAYLYDLFGRFYLVPEGGANYWGINGCMEILKKEYHSFDYVIGACGTGTMISGILLNIPERMKVIGVSALKGDFMTDEIKKHLQLYLMDDEAVKEYLLLLTIWNDAHFGGYGKCPAELQTFIRSFYDKTTIPLDGIYTGKVVHAVSKHALEGKFESGSKIMIVHSGGIQGNAGLNYRLRSQLPIITD